MSYSYVVTANPPTAVTHVLTASLSGPRGVALNVIVAKATRLEVHLVTPEGLVLLLDVPINGRIAELHAFRPSGCACDRLFLLTEARQFAILSYESGGGGGGGGGGGAAADAAEGGGGSAAGELVTHAHGDLSDRIGRACDSGPWALVEPTCRAIACHIYDGLLKV